MQRYFSLEKQDDYFILDNRDLYHIKTVMRMKDGDLIEVVFEKKVYECCIQNVKSNISILIKKELKNHPQNTPDINLVIPLLQENKLDLILQKATEMGVSKIYICQMKHCMVKLEGNKKENKINRWMRIIKEASEQSKRIDIPKLEFLDELKNASGLNGLKLVCSTKERQNNLKRVLTKNKNCDRINLVIGPEGGLSCDEEKFLIENDFIPITLGSNILRVESVPMFLLGAINYEYME